MNLEKLQSDLRREFILLLLVRYGHLHTIYPFLPFVIEEKLSAMTRDILVSI